MNNLTEKQQLIISDITNEFTKINDEKKNRPKGGLFDIDGLLGQREADIEERYQIERNNEFYDKILIAKIDEDIDILNIDLKELGLRAFRPNGWASWVRGYVIDTIGNFERDYGGDNKIRLQYRLFTKTKYFESGISYIEESSSKHNIESCSKFFDNLEEFAKSTNTIGGIKKLINSIK